MNIIVCVKQVPGTSDVKVDPDNGTLIRDGVESKMNPYDLYALELGLSLKEQYGGTLSVISMGPPPAEAVIREAICMGADSGVLISDRRFGGADVLATSYTISQAIRALGKYDLIITGKQTTDGDTAQVGPETAEFLGVPHSTNVRCVTNIKDSRIHYVYGLDNKVITANMQMPCVICTDADINTPRLPSYRRKLATESDKTLVRVISLDDFSDKDTNHYGLAGSPTQVERIFPPEKNTDRRVFEGDSAVLAEELFSVLKAKKYV